LSVVTDAGDFTLLAVVHDRGEGLGVAGAGLGRLDGRRGGPAISRAALPAGALHPRVVPPVASALLSEGEHRDDERGPGYQIGHEGQD